ncbi:MAG: hypothetical protein LQ342_005126 [Letrouitia transgressa]|nr:MAG: hypothetical protein LQ342_005126 [Letrouitia transgressa]
MPSPEPELSQNSTQPRQPPSSTDTPDHTPSNGVQGDKTPLVDAPVADPIQEGKQKAKEVMAASGVSIDTHASSNSLMEANQPAVAASTDSGEGQSTPSRKRSRSGTRILRSLSPKATENQASETEKQWLHKKLLEQYVTRDMRYLGALADEHVASGKIVEAASREAKQYESWAEGELEDKDNSNVRKPNPLRRVDPGAIFGKGYSGHGNGTTETPPVSLKVLYPLRRPRAGGRRTRELRISRQQLVAQSEQRDELVPIRLDIEWDKIRLRDTFTWNLHDRVVPPELFAEGLVEDFKLPPEQCGPIVQQVCESLKEQIQDYHPHVFIREEALDPHLPYHAYKDDEMRITIKLNITIGQQTLVDQFEWDINNPLNCAEDFAKSMTQDLSLSGEFTTAIAHSIREQSQLFTRSLYVTGHSFDGRPIEDQELQSSFLPSPLPSSFRPYQAAKDYTPYLYELNEAELEKTEMSLSREERRQKRSVNRRGGPALPDLKDRRRTIRTLVISSVLPNAAEGIEDSRILKRAPTSSGRGRRPGYGTREGIDDSDESDSEESSPGSPAIPPYLLAGTARTRGMRGAATAAQAAMRGNIARSATPEALNLHHHEPRSLGRRPGSNRDMREESVDEPTTYIIKLKLPRERFRQLLRDLRTKTKPEQPQSTSSSRRSQSATPGQGTPAPGSMPPPPITPTNQPQTASPSRSVQPQQQQTKLTNGPIQPRGAQLGRVDALGPPSQENPIPSPPAWLTEALQNLQATYPHDLFEGTMRYTAVSTITDEPISLRPDQPQPENVKYMYYPRIKCKDCPGKLYTPGPENGVNNFEVHLKNRLHRENVQKRVMENGG